MSLKYQRSCNSSYSIHENTRKKKRKRNSTNSWKLGMLIKFKSYGKKMLQRGIIKKKLRKLRDYARNISFPRQVLPLKYSFCCDDLYSNRYTILSFLGITNSATFSLSYFLCYFQTLNSNRLNNLNLSFHKNIGEHSMIVF